MTPIRVLTRVAIPLLALALVAWVAEQPGRALRSPAAAAERGAAAIGSGYTLHAVTADRPRVFVGARRGDGRPILATPPATSVHGPGFVLPGIGVRDGPAPSAPPLDFGLSRRAPPGPA